MQSISIVRINDTTFNVIVNSRTVTTHRVTISVEYHRKLTSGTSAPEDLIRRSFEFLLEREPNTSILRSFDLTVINRYFPEYEETMRHRERY